jgi:selenium metabolism protein YedF
MPESSRHDEFALLVASDSFGRGDDDLGKLLMDRFLHEVGGASGLPDIVIFMNAGVKLVAEASPVLEHLRRLDQSGVELFACTTCLERFDLADKVEVGTKSDMRSIVEMLTRAARVITV